MTAVGILSASPGLAGAIEQYAIGAVDPRPLVAATVGLDEAGAVLGRVAPAGRRRRPEDPHRSEDDMTEFDGLVAVVTGGASGIGAATAALLAQPGRRVAILDRDVWQRSTR